MIYENNKVKDIKIAYIGGGSRGWAWGLMSDLAKADDISGSVYLYDIDKQAALDNEIIGNKMNALEDNKSDWNYKATDTIDEALKGADFVVISILPGTFEEMESDVHVPEKYGIYQAVGDTAGPGGIIRALRTIPMFEHIANKVKENCPDAWVINYTNPMTVCVRTLYKTFPEIKAFGCCHEVFGTQKLLCEILEEFKGIKDIDRTEIKVNVVGVNHFTWLTSAHYQNTDLFPLYREFAEKYKDSGYSKNSDTNWLNAFFETAHRVKIDLFLKYGYIAAAGDRHLAEFSDGEKYLKNPEQVASWMFGLTPVEWRKNHRKNLCEKSEKLKNGDEELEITITGEEGVEQIRAILGLRQLVTNVNMPNMGQIPNLPLDAVVETNAVFTDGTVTPVFSGKVPDTIYPLVSRVLGEQEIIAEAGHKKDLDLAFSAFLVDPLVTIDSSDAKKLFDEMVENTKEYLKDYLAD